MEGQVGMGMAWSLIRMIYGERKEATIGIGGEARVPDETQGLRKRQPAIEETEIKMMAGRETEVGRDIEIGTGIGVGKDTIGRCSVLLVLHGCKVQEQASVLKKKIPSSSSSSS